jgi:DNA-binding transcriptional MerR regulator
MTDSYLLAGRFGAVTSLTPKALRLYAEQGLLTPAHVDRATGYRYYAADQIPRARLIARLRRLGLPMARIAGLICLSPEARAVELRAWLSAQAARLADQSELVEALTQQAGVEQDDIGPVRMRDRAATKLLFRQRQVDVGQLDPFMDGAEADLRAHLRASGLAADGPMSVHFNDPVSRDNDGLVEVAISYEGQLQPIGDLRIRLHPAGREAYLPVPAGCENFPMILRVYDAIEAWLEADSGRTCAGVPYEIWPGSDGARFDVVYPI